MLLHAGNCLAYWLAGWGDCPSRRRHDLNSFRPPSWLRSSKCIIIRHRAADNEIRCTGEAGSQVLLLGILFRSSLGHTIDSAALRTKLKRTFLLWRPALRFFIIYRFVCCQFITSFFVTDYTLKRSYSLCNRRYVKDLMVVMILQLHYVR